LSVLGIVYLLAGGACIAYYLLIGFYSRFGLSIQWIWLVAGAALIAAGLLTHAPLPRWLRYAWRTALVAGLLLLAGLMGLVISGMNASAPPGMDYLVVLGASVYADGPSPALTRRINAVMDCLDKHPDAVIIASGGQGKSEPISETASARMPSIAAESLSRDFADASFTAAAELASKRLPIASASVSESLPFRNARRVNSPAAAGSAPAANAAESTIFVIKKPPWQLISTVSSPV